MASGLGAAAPDQSPDLYPGTHKGVSVKFSNIQSSGSPPEMMVGPHFQRYGIVGHSDAIAEVIRRIDLVSATRSTVVITGETGTGKELVARAVHHRSPQRDMPFVKVNCAGMSAGHSRTPRARREASSRWPTGGPSCSTKSAR